jgi:hypothetical protein
MKATGVFWMIKGNWKGVGRLYISNFHIILDYNDLKVEQNGGLIVSCFSEI